MVYIKLFQTEQEKQACTDTYEYIAYIVETDEVYIHEKEHPFFCKLTLNNEDVVEIEGSGELTSAMVSQYKSTTVNVEFGELCTSIGNGAFVNCNLLTSITIPNSITSIGDGAFFGCSGLISIKIPDNVISIGSSAFQNCSGLTSVTIGNSVTSIGNIAFSNCTSLTSITIPNSVTSIGGAAFYNCSGLTSITIGNSVTSIGDDAFQGCTSLTNITSLATTAPTIQSRTFSNIKTNGTLYVTQGSSGYDIWMSTSLYYLGYVNWTKVE